VSCSAFSYLIPLLFFSRFFRPLRGQPAAPGTCSLLSSLFLVFRFWFSMATSSTSRVRKRTPRPLTSSDDSALEEEADLLDFDDSPVRYRRRKERRRRRELEMYSRGKRPLKGSGEDSDDEDEVRFFLSYSLRH
jgi:hypothetical protein